MMSDDLGASVGPGGTEAWVPVPGYEGLYEVSRRGQFRSLYFCPPRMVALSSNSDGYKTIALSKDGVRKSATAHRLVCRAFHGEPEDPALEAAHLDGDRTNPAADNLAWTTKRENHAHKRLHGTWREGETHPGAKLTQEQAQFVADQRGKSLAKSLGEQLGVSVQAVHDIWRGKRWGKFVTVADKAAKRGGTPREINPNSKLSPDQAKQLVLMKKAGATPKELMQRFGLSRASIYRIARRAQPTVSSEQSS